MASYVKYQNAVEAIHLGQINFGTDVLKLALTNTAPNVATHTALADITEIGAGNGYTAGGATVTVDSAGQTAGTFELAVTTDVTWTASGGAIGPFRYVVFYSSTADKLISYWDRGASLTLNDGETFTADITDNLFTAV